MVCGKYALRLVDQFSSLASMASAYPYYSSVLGMIFDQQI